MRNTTLMAFALATGWLAVGVADASAAWNNAFQVTSCRRGPSSYYAPAPAPCCPPTVSYVQRCYYQPVTTYQTKTYYEPVNRGVEAEMRKRLEELKARRSRRTDA